MTDTILLISGSAQATDRMIAYAVAAAERAVEKGWDIIVGDNPQGIDYAVLPYATMVCCIDQARSIHRANPAWPVSEINPTYQQFHQRDQQMCHLATKGLFIWNGKSKGTKAAYDYMLTLYDRELWLVDFDGKTPYTSHKITKPEPELEQVRMF